MIKTGRQIVQKQQTEQPKELDDRLTALKLAYNVLGSQVRDAKCKASTLYSTNLNTYGLYCILLVFSTLE